MQGQKYDKGAAFKWSWYLEILLYITVKSPYLVLEVDALNFTAIYVLKRHLLYT
jgi:hypothetical protein